MPAPTNHLKAAMLRGEMQLGLWLALDGVVAAEIASGAGFDWVLIDGEHAPYDISRIEAQMRAMAAKDTPVAVRVPSGADWILKQVLDLGAQTVMVPMVETADEARAIAKAVRYPPGGARGLAAGLVRASRHNEIADYATTANDEICLIVQVESVKGLENIEEIAAVEGVDCVFVGPGDLSASMGFLMQSEAPEVIAAIDEALAKIKASGKLAGILDFNRSTWPRYEAAGVTFLAVECDLTLYAKAVRGFAKELSTLTDGTP